MTKFLKYYLNIISKEKCDEFKAPRVKIRIEEPEENPLHKLDAHHLEIIMKKRTRKLYLTIWSVNSSGNTAVKRETKTYSIQVRSLNWNRKVLMARLHPECGMSLREPYLKENNSKWNWHRGAKTGWVDVTDYEMRG